MQHMLHTMLEVNETCDNSNNDDAQLQHQSKADKQPQPHCNIRRCIRLTGNAKALYLSESHMNSTWLASERVECHGRWWMGG